MQTHDARDFAANCTFMKIAPRILELCERGADTPIIPRIRQSHRAKSSGNTCLRLDDAPERPRVGGRPGPDRMARATLTPVDPEQELLIENRILHRLRRSTRSPLESNR